MRGGGSSPTPHIMYSLSAPQLGIPSAFRGGPLGYASGGSRDGVRAGKGGEVESASFGSLLGLERLEDG
jgi:hypothetical protein